MIKYILQTVLLLAFHENLLFPKLYWKVEEAMGCSTSCIDLIRPVWVWSRLPKFASTSPGIPPHILVSTQEKHDSLCTKEMEAMATAFEGSAI